MWGAIFFGKFCQSFQPNGANVIISYNFSVPSLLQTYTEAILCFLVDDIEQCVTVLFEFSVCPVPPDECIDWAGKTFIAENCRILENNLIYDLNLSGVGLPGGGYQFCNNSSYEGSISGEGELELNEIHYNNSGSSLEFESTLIMPCDFDISLDYTLILYGCNSQGDLVCFEFIVEFPDCEGDCDRDRAGERSSLILEDSPSFLFLWPNPVREKVNVKIENYNEKYQIVIYDQFGKLHLAHEGFEAFELDLSTLASGIYIVKAIGNNGIIIDIEKLSLLN